ncbi:AAA family ATPase [Streptomyces poriferorum]|uniref:AAA family ATPase n=1 Tax=Streptomyces poriferorum TaxID=2798799 RepID=A0ABY9IFN4_9ACTN|nr:MULTISPECIES: AAA family ATPase [unclassified Streptomyces]MDP5315637.1 AAA family ATPase [Streptomyces sp. Alt4]WLQ54006.1 AAA family ATPase [Streptomyces sp. Alt2]
MTTVQYNGLRVAFVGAYGNGKTTLTTRLTQITRLPRTHGSAMRDPLGASGKSLEDCSEAELLQLTVRRFTERRVGEALLPQGFLSDGSVLHEWIYAKVRLALGRFPDENARPAGARRFGASAAFEEVNDQIGQLALSHARQSYDLVVHLPAEVPLADTPRPISEAFRTISDQLLLAELGRADVPFHVIAGSPEERFQECCRLMASCALPEREGR